MKYLLLTSIIAGGLMVLVPQPVSASVVVCGLSHDDLSTPGIREDQNCTACLLLFQVKRVIDFVALDVTPIFAGVLIVVAGLVIILGGANPELISTGKKMFTNTIIGVLIIYGSYMIANFTIKSVAADSDVATSWFELKCEQARGVLYPYDPATNPNATWSPPPVTPGSKSDADARQVLRNQDINPDGIAAACSPAGTPSPCGSFEGVRNATLEAIISLKKDCPTCVVTVNDATGPRHRSDSSHYTGNALDIQHSATLDTYIKTSSNFTKIDDSHWRDNKTGVVYYEEDSAHWHMSR